MPAKKPTTVEEYLSTAAEKRPALESMREIIRKAAPKAEDVINYSMPAVKINGIIVWYAAFKTHIGLYPRPSAIQLFAKELAKYTTSKGAIQFPLDQPLPAALISKIVKFRIQEDAEEASRKAAKKKAPAKKAPSKKSPAKKATANNTPAKKAPAKTPAKKR